MQDKSKPAIALKHLKLDGDEEKLVTEVCETIIPATDTPGAKDTFTHLFVLRMVDDMYPKEEQDQFVKGMKEFDKLSEKKYDKSFVEASPAQREELLASIINNDTNDVSADVAAFLKTMKKLTVQGYMSSKYYLSNVRVYKLVPGKFYGCIPVTSLSEKGPSI